VANGVVPPDFEGIGAPPLNRFLAEGTFAHPQIHEQARYRHGNNAEMLSTQGSIEYRMAHAPPQAPQRLVHFRSGGSNSVSGTRIRSHIPLPPREVFLDAGPTTELGYKSGSATAFTFT